MPNKQTEYSTQYLDNLSLTPTDPPYVRRVIAGTTISGAIVPIIVGDDGSFTSGLGVQAYDYVVATYPNGTTEVYTFKTGGSGGTTVSTVTVVYTDSTKESLSTVTRT